MEQTPMPQSSDAPQTPYQAPQAPADQPETAAPVFQAYLPPEAPPGRSRLPLALAVLGGVVLVVGWAFYRGRPDEAEAKPPAIDVASMTAAELAEDAGPAAARELVRRLLEGTPAEHAAAAAVMNTPPSPRLARNLAMAMALAQQKRANEMRVRAARHMRMAEQGY